MGINELATGMVLILCFMGLIACSLVLAIVLKELNQNKQRTSENEK